MLRSVLQALDSTDASIASLQIGLDIAAATNARMTGLIVLDPQIVTPAEPVPLGASDFKEHKDAVLMQRARTLADDLARKCLDAARARNVSYETRIVMGDTLGSLISEADRHDIIVAAMDVALEGSSGQISELVVKLLHDNPRPVIVSGAKQSGGTRTLISYDGSLPAMRAIQMFSCLGIRKDLETLVLCYNQDAEAASRLADRGAAFMQEHGYRARAMTDISSSCAATSIIATADAQDVGMIVAGAYGHGGWREWLLGSTTTRLLQSSPVPVFIHH